MDLAASDMSRAVDGQQTTHASAAETSTARSHARRRRILMEGAAAGSHAGKPVLPAAPLAMAPVGGTASQTAVTLQLQAESLARKLAQEQAVVANLQEEQREVLAVNERLRHALVELSQQEGDGIVVTQPLHEGVMHVLARALWLRLRQCENTYNAVRELMVAVQATSIAARQQLVGESASQSIEAAQKLMDHYAGRHSSSHEDMLLLRSIVLPHTDAHDALGAGAAAALATVADILEIGPAAKFCEWTDLSRLDHDLTTLTRDVGELRQDWARGAAKRSTGAGMPGAQLEEQADACAMQ